MAIDPRIPLLQDFAAPAQLGATIAGATDPTQAIKMRMALDELSSQAAYRNAQIEESRANRGLRLSELGFQQQTAQRQQAEADQKYVENEAKPYAIGFMQKPDRATAQTQVALMKRHPDPRVQAAAAQWEAALAQVPDEQLPAVASSLVAKYPEWSKQMAEVAFQKPEKEKDQWSDPYQMGGATVQRNQMTGEIRTAVSRPPVTNVGVGGLGKPPSGYRWNPSGELEAIPGGPAAQKQTDAQRKSAVAVKAVSDKADRTIATIDQALGKVGTFTTGIPGAVTRKIPGTPAFDLNALVDSVKANIGFDTLTEMRQVSPTGGALGQVTERELQFLQSAVASLETAQSEAQVVNALKKLRTHYENWKNAVQQYHAEQYGDVPANTPAATPQTAAPKVGTVEGGYRFKGGDPSKPENWEKQK